MLLEAGWPLWYNGGQTDENGASGAGAQDYSLRRVYDARPPGIGRLPVGTRDGFGGVPGGAPARSSGKREGRA